MRKVKAPRNIGCTFGRVITRELQEGGGATDAPSQEIGLNLAAGRIDRMPVTQLAAGDKRVGKVPSHVANWPTLKLYGFRAYFLILKSKAMFPLLFIA